MTRSEVIQLARQANLPFAFAGSDIPYIDELEAFADMVSAAEREACARLFRENLLKDKQK